MAIQKRVFLIDGSAVVYRSYFAFIRKPLINSKGQNVSAVSGFLNTLFRLLIDEKPDYIAIAFDTGHPTFRHEMYGAYKATREKMPDDLRDQLPICHQLAEAINIPILEMPGYEADDIIGTIAKRADAENMEVYLVSGDKDFMQLVSDNVKMYALTRSGNGADITWYDEVEAKFGVHPDQVIDVLGLMGDSSDNVPGVQGVGPKTASKLIKEFGSMEQLYERIDELKPSKNKERLIEQKDMALLSKQLVTIKTDVPVGMSFDDMVPHHPDAPRMIEIMDQMEFNTLKNRFEQYLKSNYNQEDNLNPITQSQTTEVAYTTVTDMDTFKKMMLRIKAYTAAFDTETTGLNSLDCELVGISFSVAANEAFYLPMNHPFAQTHEEEIWKALKSYFEKPIFKKVGHNVKFDALVLSQYGVRVRGIYFDTMIAHYLLNPGARHHNLDDMAKTMLNHQMISIESLIGKGKSQKSMADVDIEIVSEFAAEDADITLQLFELLEPQIKRENLEQVCFEIEMPLLDTLIDVERNGVYLDTDFLKVMSNRLATRISEVEQNIYNEVGEEINLNSPRQLGPVLFDKLEIHKSLNKRAPKKTKTGQYSTAEAELLKFEAHPVVRMILEYRELTKLKSTYVDAIPLLINPKTGAVHTSFNQTIAATGRLSSTDPNFQNIPIKTELGREIRKAFVPRESGNVILSADYSQIELRLMAHLSEDAHMIEAFQQDKDIHSTTAAAIFSVPIDDVTTEMRRKAKEINFGIIYGMSKYGLSSRLNISVEEATAFIDSYFIRYPGVRNFMDQAILDAKTKGYAETMCGRRRSIPEIHSDNRMIREGAERVAINTPIQGSAADLIKLAMIHIARAIGERGLTSKMILQVHDELVFDVPAAEIDVMTELVRSEMGSALEVSVPLKVELGTGSNWLEAH